MPVCGRVTGCHLEKSWDTIYLESQNRLCIDSVFQGLTVGGLFITHWQETDAHSELSVILFPGAIWPTPWVLPGDTLLWAADPGHSEAGVQLRLNWNGPRDSRLDPQGDVSTLTWQTTFIFLWQIPRWQRPSVTLECLINLTLCFWAPALCDADFPGDTSSDNPHLLLLELFQVRPYVEHVFACLCFWLNLPPFQPLLRLEEMVPEHWVLPRESILSP